MRRVAIVLLALTLALASLSPQARASAGAGSADQPRRNVRLGFALGQGLVSPPLCSDCRSFWGRALGFVLDVGWTVRRDLVLSLEQQAALIGFADGTTASLGGAQLAVRYFWRPRTCLLGAAGVGFRDVVEDQNARHGVLVWSKTGALLSVGAGWEPGRKGAWSYDLQLRATAVVADGVAPGLLALLGGSWN